MNAILWQHWKQNPGRFLLTLASMAIATATVIGALLASNAVRQAYRDLVQAVEPEPSLEITAQQGGRFDPTPWLDSQHTPGVTHVLPLVYRSSLVRSGEHRTRGILLGTNLNDESPTTSLKLESGRLPHADTDECVLPASLANGLHVELGGEVIVLAKRGFSKLKVVGIAEEKSWMLFAREASLLMPIDTLQRAFGLGNTIDSLRLLVEADVDRDSLRSKIAEQIPAEWNVHLPENRIQVGEEMLRSTELGLMMACGMAIVMAAFIILNASRMNVAEHRRHYSILRCIGATQSQVQWLVLRETMIVGTCGSLLGIGLGYYVGRLISSGMSAAVRTDTPQVEWDLWSVLAPAVLLPLVGIVAAWIPTRQAGKISPLEGFRESSAAPPEPFPLRLVLGGLIAWGVSSLVVWSVVAHRLPPWMAVPAGLVTLLGYILWLPLLVPLLVKLFLACLRGPFLLATELASDQLMRRQTRTGLTAGVLVVALCGSIGLGHGISNNVDEVRHWYARSMSGDYFVTPTAVSSVEDANDPLRQGLLNDEDVASVDSLSFITARINDQSIMMIVRDFPKSMAFPSLLIDGEEMAIRRQLKDGEVLLSSVLSKRIGASPGDKVRMEVRNRTFEFRVAGVSQEFWQGGMVVMLQREAAQKKFVVTGADLFIVALRETESGTESANAAKERIQNIAVEQGAIVNSLADLKQTIEATLNRVVGSLWTVILLTFVASGMGVANTLAMSIREQMRELGLLRIIGMSRGQLLALVLSEAWLLCLLGTILGTLAGITSALIMHFCNEPLLGYSPKFEWHYWLFYGSIGLAFLVATLAIIRPARLATRMNLLESVSYE